MSNNLDINQVMNQQIEDSNQDLHSIPTSPIIKEEINKLLKEKRNINFDLVTTEELETELKRRYLSIPLHGHVEISLDNKVSFGIDNLTWPPGKYKIQLVFKEEIK